MITDVEYMQIVSEAYDLSDYATKKKVLFCNEAKKVENIEHIVSKLYVLIKNDCTGIDFGTIPKSKGIINNIEHYQELIDCIDQISELVRAYKENTNIIDEISTAIANIKQREREFGKAFVLNIDLPIIIYNITVLSIVSSISLLITSSVEYIKNGHDSFKVSFDKAGYYKTKDHVLYDYIIQFNRNCANKTIDKIINDAIKNNVVAESFDQVDQNEEALNEGKLKDALQIGGEILATGLSGFAANKIMASGVRFPKPVKIVAIIVSAGIAAISLLKLTKKLITWFLKMKMKTSDWFEAQSEFLRINAENLKYRDDEKGDDHRKQVYQSQIKWADKFKKIANFIAIKDSKARKEADDEEKNRDRTPPDDDNDDSDGDGGLF